VNEEFEVLASRFLSWRERSAFRASCARRLTVAPETERAVAAEPAQPVFAEHRVGVRRHGEPDRSAFARIEQMTRGVLGAIFLVAFASHTAVGQIATERWVQAETDIRRLTPARYRGLPRSISRYLTRHGFTVPQSYDVDRPHNVLQGRFDSGTTKDWAVLASRGGYSRILLFWGGSTAKVTAINRKSDADYLETTGQDTIGYTRRIDVVGRAYIFQHYRWYGGPRPPAIRHDAIDDGRTGSASGVFYFDGKKWHALQGAD